MDRPERIAYFENKLNELCAALEALNGPLENFAAAQEAARELDDYYSGGLWQADYAADERGELPPPVELPRGVLSEDALYNALCLNRELLKRMRELSGEFLWN